GHHPATLVTLQELAWAYRNAGEVDKALPLFQQAAAGVERLKFAHGSADVIVRSLSSCHEQLKQYDQAEVWRRKWLAVGKREDGPGSAAYAKELTGLGSNLLLQKRHAEAEPLLRESLAILQNKQAEDRGTFYTQSLLGAALLGRQKYAEAEPLLVRGYQGMSKVAKDL